MEPADTDRLLLNVDGLVEVQQCRMAYKLPVTPTKKKRRRGMHCIRRQFYAFDLNKLRTNGEGHSTVMKY